MVYLQLGRRTLSTMKSSALGLLTLIVVTAGITVLAAEPKTDKPKPYPLKTCIVADEELGGMGKPFVFVHEGQEIKMCCKSCKKDFDKDPKKFLKKLEKDDKKK